MTGWGTRLIVWWWCGCMCRKFHNQRGCCFRCCGSHNRLSRSSSLNKPFIHNHHFFSRRFTSKNVIWIMMMISNDNSDNNNSNKFKFKVFQKGRQRKGKKSLDFILLSRFFSLFSSLSTFYSVDLSEWILWNR